MIEKLTVLNGDCLIEMRRMIEAGVKFDSIVCDPPYHLTSITKRYGNPDAAPNQYGTDGAYARASRGFMGKKWDGGDIAFRVETWELALQLLNPGGFLLAFSGTRTYHRMAVAIEDAGFEIRDQIGWMYGSGFPKSHDVAKGILKSDGDTSAAEEWEGWGTALKPAWEPIVVARKPLDGTVAANMQKYGAGAINIDACRIPTDEALRSGSGGIPCRHNEDISRQGKKPETQNEKGRWPANVIHDGSDEVISCFPNSKSGGDISKDAPTKNGFSGTVKYSGMINREAWEGYSDNGSAARFFYSAKAQEADRMGSKHPTVKPLDLMAYLVKLVTRPGGHVLDPFAGSGSTGIAAIRNGFFCTLIEREEEYYNDILNRMKFVQGGDTPLFK